MFPAPHGAVCAALLPHVVKANLKALRARSPQSNVISRYDEVARLLTGDPGSKADDGAEWLSELVSDLRIPPLGSYGITRDHTKELVEKANQASSMKANPIVLTVEELADLLQAAT
jgi:alcohol dehydrogenase class IV